MALPQPDNAKPPGAQSWRDVWVRAQDSLTLHARDYGPAWSPLTPVVCLPGLTRNARDFHVLAEHLALDREAPRRVVSIDFRGRGLSEHDRDHANYTPQQETLDVLDTMAAVGIGHAVIVGTSRGGIIAMVIGAMRPAVLAGVVLNDIGPRIEVQGLIKIGSQLNRMPEPESWKEATELMRNLFQDSFTDLSDADWAAFTRQVFADEDGKPRPDFDMAIIESLNSDEIADGLPELWPQFASLAHVPVLALRGENSEIVAPETIAKMAEIHPDFTSVTVANRGHAPFLREPVVLTAIDDLLKKVDAKAAFA